MWISEIMLAFFKALKYKSYFMTNDIQMEA